jgi:Protein of unknown function (DUF4230)
VETKKQSSFSPNSLVTLVLLLLAFGGGIWLTRCFSDFGKHETTTNSTVLLEQIREVCKLVTIEGQFAEVFEYKDKIGGETFSSEKKALVQVDALVLVGYDLEKVKMESFPEKKLLKISNLPEPQILSIDHTIKFHQIENGYFNRFGEDDFTKINVQAKNDIRQKALASRLLPEAAKQGLKNLEMIRLFAESMGWKVEMDKKVVPN